jgi:hypothetical protein
MKHAEQVSKMSRSRKRGLTPSGVSKANGHLKRFAARQLRRLANAAPGDAPMKRPTRGWAD